VNASGLQVAVSGMSPGTALKLGVIRDGKPLNVNLTVGQYQAKTQEASNQGDNGQNKGKIGVAVADLNDQVRQQFNVPDHVRGVVVQQVRPGSAGEEAGLQPGDVIMEVDRKPAASASEFANQVHSNPAGKDILLLVWSRGNASYRTVHPDQVESNG
jgi:serine protease Do